MKIHKYCEFQTENDHCVSPRQCPKTPGRAPKVPAGVGN
jgi:hypothetical protein